MPSRASRPRRNSETQTTPWSRYGHTEIERVANGSPGKYDEEENFRGLLVCHKGEWRNDGSNKCHVDMRL